jgi:hypothetical protein
LQDLQFRSFEVEAQVVHSGVAQGHQDGEEGEAEFSNGPSFIWKVHYPVGVLSQVGHVSLVGLLAGLEPTIDNASKDASCIKVYLVLILDIYI